MLFEIISFTNCIVWCCWNTVNRVWVYLKANFTRDRVNIYGSYGGCVFDKLVDSQEGHRFGINHLMILLLR